ncbi:helix-turn-helix transcriptional regulator [Streptomyces humi]|uniref:LuxR family transcriptional regulator AbsR2 n=1 Tax=Streptomyces humi TaxID=1428620 RepID=UPI000628996D|nr:LuxR C-terminal-related transcriptional regulator [Streptomyces humi]
MTTYEQGARTLELPWPFTGRDGELELVRRSSPAGRRGVVVTGPAGVGKTRLITEAVRGTDCTRVTGTPETSALPFAAFAHLLPDRVSLPGAVRRLNEVRLLVVDDAHLLDEASAALVHQLAVHGRTRLLVAAADPAPVRDAVSRLWTGELLTHVVLEPLPYDETAQLLAGSRLEPLTVRRLHRVCRGDLRLLRELLGALRESGSLTPVPDTAELAWRGPLPLTATVRDRIRPLLERRGHGERDTLERLAFAEPLPPHLDEGLDLTILERLEADGLVQVDEQGAIRLAHPLYGPALRASAGRLRVRRLARTAGLGGPALRAEQDRLEERIEQLDVREVPAPVGEWPASGDRPVPAGYAAARARYSWLRGELREAAAWAREGLRGAPGDASCRTELARATAESGEAAVVRGDGGLAHYGAVRLGEPERAAGRPAGVLGLHADALARGDGPGLDRAAAALAERGLLLFAAEAHAQAVRAHRDPRAARTSRARAVALARRCQGARTPALSGLFLGELTARQRQIVTLAATGLSNRQIAEQLALSVRTVGNHLYSAYTRLGATDRTDLPWLLEQPDAQSA